MPRILTWLASLAAPVLAALSLGVAPAAAETTVLRGVTLIDGTGRSPLPDAALVLRDGRIAWVGPTRALTVAPGAEVIDLQGKYVMPGLIDLHTHVGITIDIRQDIGNYTRDAVERELGVYAAYGVTTVQTLGTDRDSIFALRAEQRAGRPTMARVFTAGQGLVFKDGFGGVAGLNRPVATPDEAARAVHEQANKGVDLIKLWVDDNLGAAPTMPPDVTLAAIQAAHARGLKVVAHVFYLADAKRLVAQGVDGLAHMVRDQPVDQDLIDAMKTRGVWQIAEALARESAMFRLAEPEAYLDDAFFRRGASPATLEVIGSPSRREAIRGGAHFHDYPEHLAMAQANARRLAAAGVKLGFGTDAGPPGRLGGYSAHEELALMVEAGFSPTQALTAATATAAAFLGAEDLGVLEAGRWGDIVVLDADPTADILNTRKIHAVYIAGRRLTPRGE